MHPDDLPVWRAGGGGRSFGFSIDPGPDPSVPLVHGQLLHLGDETLEVRHTPGHSPGHVVFYSPTAGVLFCGDLIFHRSVGRTDLPGSSAQKLVHSIHTQVYTLPPATRLLCGHGPDTTVAEEIAENPFVTL
jgi:glyoxylase-like metal-dependent hydrolase (beta-lactamase superfamily II)